MPGEHVSFKDEVLQQFKTLQEDLLSLKKAKKQLSDELNTFGIQQLGMQEDMAKDEEFHPLKVKVEKLLYDQEQLQPLPEQLMKLEKEVLLKKDYEKEYKRLQADVVALEQEIRTLRKKKDEVKMGKVLELEQQLLSPDEVKQLVEKETHKMFVKYKEMTAQLDPVKKEVQTLYKKVVQMRKDLLDFPRARIIANVILLIGLISLAGAGIALGLRFIPAANFLGIEAGILVLVGVIMRIVIALSK